MIHWHTLGNEDQLAAIIRQSGLRPQVIFKHSTRCSISSVIKSRLERAAAPEGVDFYYLDLIAHRSLSSKIAEDLQVYHESPQVLLVKNGACVYDESHYGITMDDIITAASAA
ncbi:MAG TPA: bacillithiol system redox-active protein YtxJ [Chitinophagaceae bacterium]|nr:bacillithiol system redox-active protein YtxJ [Chitinophagaceae bacterium]